MKKIILLSLLFSFLITSHVQALKWVYPFVVWDGKVYEVKQEEIINKSEIGKVIGEVKSMADDMTGEYYGDASNYYPKGTKYYEIKGTPTSTAIAVKEDSIWIKAIFAHKAPFHIMNIFSNNIFITTVIVVLFLILGSIIRTKRARNI